MPEEELASPAYEPPASLERKGVKSSKGSLRERRFPLNTGQISAPTLRVDTRRPAGDRNERDIAEHVIVPDALDSLDLTLDFEDQDRRHEVWVSKHV